MRKVLYLLAMLTAGLAGPVAAQTTPGFVQLQRDSSLQDLEMARQRALAAQRDAFAADQRYRAQQTIQSLSQSSPYASPPLGGVRPAPTDAQFAAEAERLRALQDQELAASNARILAIARQSEGRP